MVLGLGFFTIAGIVVAGRTGEPLWIFLSLPFGVVLFLAGRYTPRGYRLTREAVHVERRAGPAVIPYARIHAVDRAPRPVTGLTLFGFRGAFGSFGRFWNARLGTYRLFLANRQSIVWLRTDGGWVGLSPDRPDEFVDRLQARLEGRD